MTTYGYVRVSTDEQARSGLGLEAQRHAIAAAAGWDATWIVDEGVSGTVAPADRPALGAALDRIGSGDTLVSTRLDRLGRRSLDVLNLADRADADGWRLILLDLGLDTGTPVGRFALTALAAVAQLERDLISQRTREALAEAKRRGVRVGRPRTVPDAVAAEARRLRAAGHTWQGIADTLTAEGVPTARGGTRWTHTSVRALAMRHPLPH